MGKNQDPDIIESLETVFWVKKLKIFYAETDPGSGIFLTLDPGWKKFGSGINISDRNTVTKGMFIIPLPDSTWGREKPEIEDALAGPAGLDSNLNF
jgi:hypothetical protein